MLRGIHQASATWLGKAIMGAIMGVLVVSFAVWGIADIFNRGAGRSAVAKVGKTEISAEQFRQIYSDRLQQLGRQAGRLVTPDEARARGFDRQILSQLVAETAFDEQAKQLRLGLSDAEIAQRITGDPAFRGLTGQFDRARFEQSIRQAGFTEGRFIDQRRRELLRRQIAQGVIGDVRAPQTTLSAINQYQNEKRAIEYLTLGPTQAGDIPAPTPEALAKYFDDRKASFGAPEYRKITVLALAPSDIAKPDTVSDADAKKYYEGRKDSYGRPERRELRQLVFPNEQEAAAAQERVSKGLGFADLAKERGVKETDTDLGVVTKSDIIDPTVANAAFALKSGEVSAPVKGRFGTLLLQVGKIEPGEQKTYEQVAPEIKRTIAEGSARSAIGELRDKIEDERAGGGTLAEAAKKFELKSVTFDAVDRSGRAPDGKPVANLPKGPDVISAAFGSDVGADSDALPLPGGGYLWYDVSGVTPSRERTLDEVKDQVAARWRDDEIAKRLKTKADDMLAKLKVGTPLAQVAKEAGVQLQTAHDLQRRKPAGFVPAKAVDAVFKTAKGAIGSAEGEQATEHFIFRVTDVTDPKFDANAPEAKQLSSTLQNSYSDDILSEYVARLENDLGVTVNQAALNQAIGGGTPNN